MPLSNSHLDFPPSYPSYLYLASPHHSQPGIFYFLITNWRKAHLKGNTTIWKQNCKHGQLVCSYATSHVSVRVKLKWHGNANCSIWTSEHSWRFCVPGPHSHTSVGLKPHTSFKQMQYLLPSHLYWYLVCKNLPQTSFIGTPGLPFEIGMIRVPFSRKETGSGVVRQVAHGSWCS